MSHHTDKLTPLWVDTVLPIHNPYSNAPMSMQLTKYCIQAFMTM